MNFEDALYIELDSIDLLGGNIFPVFAIESTDSPFMTYGKQSVNYPMTLNGSVPFVEGTYSLDILTPDYDETQKLFFLVKDKILSFLGREIGKNGPRIQSVRIENVSDMYEERIHFFRLNFEMVIKYKEVT
ncbi:hypothetical protein ABEO79_00115 [Micromonospora provocatoris]